MTIKKIDPFHQPKTRKSLRLASILLVFSLLILWISKASPVYARHLSEVTFSDVTVFYQYGIQATFQARLETSSPISELVLLIQSASRPLISVELNLGSDLEIIHQVDLAKVNLQPFGPVEYWFKGRLQNGSTFESGHYNFTYQDNRFEWQSTSDTRFEVYWNSSDLTLGDLVLQIALEGLRSAVSYLPVSPPLPVRIFIYSSGRDLLEAIELGHLEWIAGHTNPELNLILVSLPPSLEQKLELERIIPHEIMHILIHQVSGEKTSTLPAWFSEGLASAVELHPNPDYAASLGQAVNADSLLPMAELCSEFPSEASQALQAYAQSASFVKFLADKYGITKLSDLLQKYTDGMDCESGLASVYGIGLEKLETTWKHDSLGINTSAASWQNLSPYFFLALLVLVPPLVGIGLKNRKKAK